MAKDKFKQMSKEHGEGVLSSFQSIATTVAEIQKQAIMPSVPSSPITQSTPNDKPQGANNTHGTTNKSTQDKPINPPSPIEEQRFMRLPNPQIPVSEYNLVSAYCNSFGNMTRQDFVELAIIEKLHTDGQLPDNEFQSRHDEIINRPPRGQRKGMKNKFN